jgi:hypothetical protein
MASHVATSSAVPILYSHWRSSCSHRVRILLNLKGIPFAYRAVDLLKGTMWVRQRGHLLGDPRCFAELVCWRWNPYSCV